jgi:Ycf66 protein N-terminus
MLNHLLAGVVALGSLVLFLSGFFFPEVQRKPDLAWSGVALLYALLLFAEGDRTPSGALLGHIASVALILWFGWQMLQQRRQFASVEEQTVIPNSWEALTPFLKESWGRMMVTYGEASTWVKDRLGKDDVRIAPEALTQQSQDWDDTSTASEPVDSTVAVSETLAVESAPESTPESIPVPTPIEANPIETITSFPELSNVESPVSSTTAKVSENVADASEPEETSAETESAVVSSDAREVEPEKEAIASHQESTAHQESTTSHPVPVSPPSEMEATLPVTETDDDPTKPSVAPVHPDDDGTWPPPEPEV